MADESRVRHTSPMEAGATERRRCGRLLAARRSTSHANRRSLDVDPSITTGDALWDGHTGHETVRQSGACGWGDRAPSRVLSPPSGWSTPPLNAAPRTWLGPGVRFTDSSPILYP